MTGREGETFPGFFYGRRGQPDAGVREVRSSQKEGDGLECRHWEFAAIYGLEEVAAREADGGFVALYRRCAERQEGGCIARAPFRHCL